MTVDCSGSAEHFAAFTLAAAVGSVNGPKHRRNEDRFVFLAPGHPVAEDRRVGYLFGVMDGCGGTAGGADAAQMTAEELIRTFSGVAAEEPGLDRREVALAGLRRANAAVAARQESDEALASMACSATVAWVWEDSSGEAGTTLAGVILHVGDSRAYLVREGGSRLLTKDHRIGWAVSQVVGMADHQFKVDVASLALEPGDLLLLATDGLWKPRGVDPADVAERAGADPALLVENWMHTARRLGSDDDLTVIAVKAGRRRPPQRIIFINQG